MSTELKLVALFQSQDCVIGPAKLAGAHDDGLEHRSNFGREDAITFRILALPVW